MNTRTFRSLFTKILKYTDFKMIISSKLQLIIENKYYIFLASSLNAKSKKEDIQGVLFKTNWRGKRGTTLYGI